MVVIATCLSKECHILINMTSCLNYTCFTKIITVAINIGDLSRYCAVTSCAVHLSFSNEKNLLMEKVGNIFQVSGRKAGVSHSL